eukprot:124156-Hanusia_phi.AAC.2
MSLDEGEEATEESATGEELRSWLSISRGDAAVVLGRLLEEVTGIRRLLVDPSAGRAALDFFLSSSSSCLLDAAFLLGVALDSEEEVRRLGEKEMREVLRRLIELLTGAHAAAAYRPLAK